MEIRRKAGNIYKAFLWAVKCPYQKSYSQSGEDIIIKNLFDGLHISKPTYLDIGANDPLIFSNTAMLYKNGSRGINIEPNPVLFRRIMRHRKGDINLNVGVGNESGELTFYVMDSDTMSSFSKETADELVEKFGFRIKETMKVRVMTISEIINKYNNGVFPDFLTIDTEGLDYDILSSIDYEKSYPKVICTETREYGVGLEAGAYEGAIVDFLISKGYKVFANTYINTILYKW